MSRNSVAKIFFKFLLVVRNLFVILWCLGWGGNIPRCTAKGDLVPPFLLYSCRINTK